MDNTKKIIVAIDGFSSSGKSTMAKDLASRVGYRYIDSGAMYRAVALYGLENALVTPEGVVNTQGLIASLPNIKIDFAVQSDGTQHTMLNGKDVEFEIRQLRVSNVVSPVAVIPEIRHELVDMQRALGLERGIVMDGRDIGTTVFPDAELKIFVDASAQTRAERRYKELTEKGSNVTFEEVLDNVVSRDEIDRNRAESPLRRAEDAIAIDNSHMTRQEQGDWLYDQYLNVLSKL